MHVENYIIIITLLQKEDKIEIKYRLLPEAAEDGIVIRDANNKVIKAFTGLAPTDNGLISFSVKDLPSGTYTCTTQLGVHQGISLKFTLH